MNKEQNLEELITRIVAPTVEDRIIQLTLINKVLFEMSSQIGPTVSGNVYKNQANLICQMIMSKNAHIINSAKGIYINDKLQDIIDPTVIGVMVRNVFETVVMFHNVFTFHESQEIKTLVYDLWDISGFLYRQSFKDILTSPESQIKQDQELKMINGQIEKIKNSNIYSNIKNPEAINHLIRSKEYKFLFKDDKVIPLSWQKAANLIQFKQNQMKGIYTHLSLYAHPSSVSVVQFGQMFIEGFNVGLTGLQFLILSSLNIAFIVEYVKFFPESIDIFNKLPDDEKFTINSLIIIIRGEEYTIKLS